MIMTLAAALMAAQSADATIPYRDHCEAATYEAWSTSFQQDGTSASNHDRSNNYCFYDGRGEIAEYRSLNNAGQPVFHGVSITIWNKDRSEGRILWAMVGVDGYTDIRQHWEEGKLVTEGDGYDPQGKFLERAVTTFSQGGDHHFVMDRSYDDGANWIAPFNVLEYLRTPHEPNPMPTQWAQQFADTAPGLVEEGGTIILDGYAWGKFIENKKGEPVGYTFASVAPKDGKWHWRTLTWTFKDGVTDVTDVELN